LKVGFEEVNQFDAILDEADIDLRPVNSIDGYTDEKLPTEMGQLASKLAWPLLTPSQLPEGYHFQSAYYDSGHQMAVLTYVATRPLPGSTDSSLTATKTIARLQALKNDFVPLQIAPDTHMDDVQVNDRPGVYALGAWDTQFFPDNTEPNGGKMVSTWRNDLPIQNLFWQVGNVYLALITDDQGLIKQNLVDMAAMIW
jgi:hypothetical protein